MQVKWFDMDKMLLITPAAPPAGAKREGRAEQGEEEVTFYTCKTTHIKQYIMVMTINYIYFFNINNILSYF